MVSTSIENWVSNTSNGIRSSSDDEDFSSRSSRLTWDTVIDHARSKIFTSKLSIRLPFLQQDLLLLVKSTPAPATSDAFELIKLLFETIPRYEDTHSRKAVLVVLLALLHKNDASLASPFKNFDSGLTATVIKFLSQEASSSCSKSAGGAYRAPGTRFALLLWASQVLQTSIALWDSSSSEPSTITLLVNALGLLFDSLHEPQLSRAVMLKSATVIVRRAVRTNHEKIPHLLQNLTRLASPVTNASLLGLVIDVALRLRIGKELAKGAPDGIGVGYVIAYKDQTLHWWTTQVLGSKSCLSPWTTCAFSDFFSRVLTADDFDVNVLNPATKFLIRSPEVAMPALTNFVRISPHLLPSEIRTKFLPAIASASLSSNSETRNSAQAFFEVLFRDLDSEIIIPLAAETVSYPLKMGKTANPEHRATLLNMLACLKPSMSSSPTLIKLCCEMLSKETNENALKGVATTIQQHLKFLLDVRAEIDPFSIHAITKSMQDPKPIIRKTACLAIGLALWRSSQSFCHSTADFPVALPIDSQFQSSLARAFEVNLKNASTNPLASVAGPIEGYVAIALCGSPLFDQSPDIQALWDNNPVLRSLILGSPKPSFLFLERLIRKPTATQDESIWLARALDSVFQKFRPQLLQDSLIRTLFSHAILFLALECPYHETRKLSTELLEEWYKQSPELASLMLVCGLQDLAVNNDSHDKLSPTVLDTRLRFLLSNLIKNNKDTSEEVKTRFIVDCFVACHQPAINDATSFWVGLAHLAGLEPKKIILSHFQQLMSSIENILSNFSDRGLKLCDAAYRAVTTLCIIVPDVSLPQVVQQIFEHLNSEKMAYLGAFELGVWSTPSGQTFVDVLASRKSNEASAKNTKVDSIERWELEVRASLAQKKAGASTVLSKAEKALVEAQLVKEAEVRDRVAITLASLKRGYSLIHSLIKAHKTSEITLRDYAVRIVNHCIGVLQTDAASLVLQEGLSAFFVVGEIFTAKLGSVREPLMWCMLRGLNTKVVPKDMTVEPLADLVTRVLYKIRSLAEQQSIDGPTFACFAPLLSQVITKRGLGLQPSQVEESLEQIALVIDIVNFAGSEATKMHDLRLRLIEDCLTVIGTFPQLIKAATLALVTVGSSMSLDASEQDIRALLLGLLSSESQSRYAALQAAQPLDMTDIEWSPELWIARHDEDERNAGLASDLWLENGLKISENCLDSLLSLLEHSASSIRDAAAKSIAEAVQVYPHLAKDAFVNISNRYQFLARELVPQYDAFGMIIPESLDQEDPWQYRAAQANTLYYLALTWENTDILPLFDFLVQRALGDRNELVRTRMLAAGNAAIDLRGAEHLEKLISTLKAILANGAIGPTAAVDHVTEAAVLLFGRLARHLSVTDERLTDVIDRLVGALKTPSEVVQSAISDCLPPLVRLRKSEAPILIQRLLGETLNGIKYAERRGAAYGLAGAIKGRGITSIQEFAIFESLRNAMEDKKNPRARQGALFAFKILTNSLGRLFEPYLIPAIPFLLTAFGDGAAEVREAIQDTAKEIMRGLSGHAVKLILPSLLMGLNDKQWRTKKGAIELMGAMAYLAPKQLSMSLPTIIPRLTETLTDTHAQVRTAANSSLKKFGEVVTNPEISAIQEQLLGALVDPALKTGKALDSLLGTAFVHYVDTSSLALLIPIIERGLRERSADIKRKATQIVGNLATLTESKDLSPYLPQLMPKVRQVLVDPVPEARATAAKALGTLVERLGEDSFPELVSSLFDTLRRDAPGVDQQGAAQGLSEIMSGLGTEKLDDLLPEIISNTNSPKAFVREGFISLLIFLPATYGERFSPYLGRIIRPVLNGLADDSDYVREASMRAGSMIITNHSTKAVDLLMPELEKGVFHESWRIRQSSIRLLGDLLFRISGITAKADLANDDVDDEEAVITNAEASRMLIENLGKERRDKVLAAVYVTRQDSSGIVRSTSVQIWKALVHNTPKVAREIMPSLMQCLIQILASPGEEQQETAARTLCELVKKLGDNIMGVIILNLQKSMHSEDNRFRQGVSLALIHLISSISQTQLEDNESALIGIVRSALVDPHEAVRSTAAKAFDSLQQRLGSTAVEHVLPTLLHALRQSGDSSEAALAALKELMRVGAANILPQLLPVLNRRPITPFNARALASLVSVSGNSITKYISSVVDSLMLSRREEQDKGIREALDHSLNVLLGSLEELDTINVLMIHLLGMAKSETPTKRVDGCDAFSLLCASNTVSRSDYNVLWVRQLVSLLDDPVPDVVDSAWVAMDEMVKAMPKNEMDVLVVPLRRAIESSVAPGRHLPGFSRPSGLKPLMPILLHGILTGAAEQREQAALAFGDIVERCSEEHVKPYVTQITGPLIRIMGDRFPAPVKSAILQTLGVLLSRIPQFVKPFFPQLQRTFMKSLYDVASLNVRKKAINALGLLMNHQPRIDPLITELLGGIKSCEDIEIHESLVFALAAVVANGRVNVGQAIMTDVTKFLDESFDLERHSEGLALALSHLVGAVASGQPTYLFPLMKYILSDPPTMLGSMCIRQLVENVPDALYDLGMEQEVVTFLLKHSASSYPPHIGRPLREAREAVKISPKFAGDKKFEGKL
ncbi:hypothetical protein O181_019025 [Austropuccinia psidii MF-1]|uniref:TOG domain-containing protein n=1 Tax=Austropuccinia psidii MF-1 TaxID=1389203 RepID=A0A9Q3CAZ5_9BASI|nr:hypothetical protein [Austropuccinia psidii MF-1]